MREMIRRDVRESRVDLPEESSHVLGVNTRYPGRTGALPTQADGLRGGEPEDRSLCVRLLHARARTDTFHVLTHANDAAPRLPKTVEASAVMALYQPFLVPSSAKHWGENDIRRRPLHTCQAGPAEKCHVPDIRTRCNPTYPDPPRWIGVQFTSLSLLPRHRWWSFCR
jgi:hypothetical protein